MTTEDGKTKKSNSFKKHVYNFKNGKIFLIHYIGDEKAYNGVKHGNRKNNNREHKRTFPSVLNNIKESTGNREPAEVYRDIQSDPQIPFHGKAINMNQIKRNQSKTRQENKLSHDFLYNMHELAYHLDGYVMSIVTYPDLVVIIGDDGQMKEFDRLLSTKLCGDHLQLSYDTRFQLGDFYLSTLI